MKKEDWQKRSILIQKLNYLLELDQNYSVAHILYALLYPVEGKTHPGKLSDNSFLGLVETEINKIEDGGED